MQQGSKIKAKINICPLKSQEMHFAMPQEYLDIYKAVKSGQLKSRQRSRPQSLASSLGSSLIKSGHIKRQSGAQVKEIKEL